MLFDELLDVSAPSEVHFINMSYAAALSGTDQADQEQQFKHSPLPDASDYIRLLSIEYAGPTSDSSARYTLSAWHFDEVPKYHAISYTWGLAEENEVIMLEGKPKSVRKNCADVLRQLCHFRTAEYYWIDTLCIDQDNLEEKSWQVAVMGYIYEEAVHVLVCIGMAKGESSSSLNLLRDYGKYRLGNDQLLRKHDRYLGSQRRFQVSIPPCPSESRRQHCQNLVNWTQRCRAVDVLDLWNLCLQLSQRDYFARVWTTPELLLSKDASIYVGGYCIRWEALYDLMCMIEHQHSATGFRLYVIVGGDEVNILQSHASGRHESPASRSEYELSTGYAEGQGPFAREIQVRALHQHRPNKVPRHNRRHEADQKQSLS